MDRLLGDYRVQGRLGAGGMGEVFRAYDPRLRRELALKVLLPSRLADQAARGRLVREARAAARLNHPNICTVYEVGEADGQVYIAMELIEGRSLADRLSSRDLPDQPALHYGRQIASALEHAHERQVVHCDLTCGNVIVTPDGRAKVLDFGLAKQMNAADPADTTTAATTGTVSGIVGTLAYMAPEQLRGELADARSDVWALGVVLYELATGERPFAGRTGFELSAAILDQTPQLMKLRPGLRDVVARCLAKDPAQRYQDAGEVRAALESVGGRPDAAASGWTASGQPAAEPTGASVGAEAGHADPPRSSPTSPFASRERRFVTGVLVFLVGGGLFWTFYPSTGPPSSTRAVSRVPVRDSRPSIAVLPFADLSPGKDQEHLSDGIAEEMLNLLATVPQLRVISRSSAFSFKDRAVEGPEIARRLNVGHVLEGSVRKSGDRVRIAARLIDARSDTQVWSQSWDRQLGDVFAIQDEIAGAVVSQLKLDLLAEPPHARAAHPEAYALFLQAREVSRQATPDGWAHSNELFEQALALDPGYAAAWDGVAANYMNQATNGVRPMDEGAGLAREAIGKALALDPNFAPAYGSLAWLAMIFDGDLTTAAQHYEHALALAPANTDILRNAAILAQYLGRLDTAISLEEYVVARDPVDPGGHHSLGIAKYYAGRADEAIESLRSALRLAPGRTNAQSTIGDALLALGAPDEALAAIEQEPSEVWRLIGLPMAYHALGRRAEAEAAVAALIRKHEKDAAYNIAYVMAYMGESDRAFEWLDRAVASGDPGLLEIVVQPQFASLRGDPRWLALLRKLGRAPDQLASISFEVTPPR